MRTYLRQKTRQPEFLWRLVLGILAAGGAIAFFVQASPDAAPPEGILVERFDEQIDEYRQYHDHLQQMADGRQWSQLWWAIPRGMWLGVAPGPTVLALVTGVCWLAFTLQAGQTHRPAGIRWFLALVAVGLGVLSIWPTLFAIYWQEEVWGLRESKDLAGGLKYFILGVGLREELSKLLLFLPLVPWIVRRGSEREALLIAACVGLGFAMEENIGYFFGDATSTAGRFLTANFFHMALTGLAGLALCRAVWHPRERAAESATIVLLAIIVHGAYDALIVLPDLAGYAILASILFILLAYQFFRELRNWWQPPGETVSLTATFLISMSLVVSATLVYLAIQVGLRDAISGAAIPAVSMGVMVYLFLREMPESIIDV